MAKTKPKTKTYTLRIPPAEVLSAYEKTRLVPARQCFATIRKGIACGCPLSAIYEANTKRKAPGMARKVMAWAFRRYGEEYTSGFVNGVDGHGPYAGRSRRYDQGYADGQRVFAAMIEKFAAVYSPQQEQPQ